MTCKQIFFDLSPNKKQEEKRRKGKKNEHKIERKRGQEVHRGNDLLQRLQSDIFHHTVTWKKQKKRKEKK